MSLSGRKLLCGVFVQLLCAPVLAGPALLSEGALDIAPGWRVVGLPEQRQPLTRYRADAVNGRRALRLDADASYGNLVRTLAPPPPRQLRWAWRAEQASAAIALHTKAGDDSPARVCVSFDWPNARVPFIERQLLRWARWRSGQPLPGATLCWAWGGSEPVGSLVENPYTRRVRTIVLRNASHSGAAWFDEQRDVEADLRRAFGDELPAGSPVPAATALIIAADADNTASRSTAWISGLVVID